MIPSRLHDPVPAPSQSVCGGPPETSTFLSFPPAANSDKTAIRGPKRRRGIVCSREHARVKRAERTNPEFSTFVVAYKGEKTPVGGRSEARRINPRRRRRNRKTHCSHIGRCLAKMNYGYDGHGQRYKQQDSSGAPRKAFAEPAPGNGCGFRRCCSRIGEPFGDDDTRFAHVAHAELRVAGQTAT